MTRNLRARTQGGAHIPAALERSRVARKKKPYKVVLEAVTQEKRKVQSILSYHDQPPPPGFGYIPVGHSEFTEWCKEQCRQRNLDVHIVSAQPKNRIHADPAKISHHVYRIGYHFPLDIIELACKKYHYTYDFEKRDGLQKQKSHGYGQDYFERGIANFHQKQRAGGRKDIDATSKDHIRGAMRDMFPKIPDKDLSSIVHHAFKEGTNRVGNSTDLPLARRIQLAVVAHIRHTYTDYDNLLKTGSWLEARQRVEHVSLAKLKEWRDETGEMSDELEETFREIIILEDDDDEVERSSDNDDDSDLSMEIVSSRASKHDLRPDPSEHFRRRVVQRDHAQIDHHPSLSTASQALSLDYHDEAHRTPYSAHTVSRLGPSVPSSHNAYTASGESKSIHASIPLQYGFHGSDLRQADFSRTNAASSVRPLQMRDASGRLYNLEPIKDIPPDPPRRAIQARNDANSSHMQPMSYQSPQVRTNAPLRPVRKDTDLEMRHDPRPLTRRASTQDVIVQSIEREAAHISANHARTSAYSWSQNTNHPIDISGRPSSETRILPASYGQTDGQHAAQTSKRMKLQYAETRPVHDDRQRARPVQVQYIDLMSSPIRTPQGRHMPSRPYTSNQDNAVYGLTTSQTPAMQYATGTSGSAASMMPAYMHASDHPEYPSLSHSSSRPSSNVHHPMDERHSQSHTLGRRYY